MSLPKSHLDFIGLHQQTPSICGLGHLSPRGAQTRQTTAKTAFIWQYVKTSFGQSLLLKYRTNLVQLDPKTLPTGYKLIGNGSTTHVREKTESITNSSHDAKKVKKPKQSALPFEQPSLDNITDNIIRNGFDEFEIGKQLLQFAHESNGIEKSIAFASIIVKAKCKRLH